MGNVGPGGVSTYVDLEKRDMSALVRLKEKMTDCRRAGQRLRCWCSSSSGLLWRKVLKG